LQHFIEDALELETSTLIDISENNAAFLLSFVSHIHLYFYSGLNLNV